ncbi:peptidoglycan-associated lipoprotein Pal [Falsiroseomonas sp. CW058]|uniref:peptidoglycan-associated lipoprotein Pal n=1 Tax=Falsiroseomonas sp. CW058 TaxID=3388664 RepID=UPI003D31AC4B
MRLVSLAVLGLAFALGACSSSGGSDANAAGRGDAALADGVGRSGLPGSGTGSARPGSQEDLVASVGDRVFFATDSFRLAADQTEVLRRQAEWLNRYRQVTVTIEGHADERGTREYNLALGQRRANTARDILVSNGVAGTRVQTISFGKDRPAELGSNAEAWARNRRAVTTVR